jgi:hypothetical protein
MNFPVFSQLAGNLAFRDGFAPDCPLKQGVHCELAHTASMEAATGRAGSAGLKLYCLYVPKRNTVPLIARNVANACAISDAGRDAP